ncbi:hypothetical protein J4206_06290 [Candidatus Woesearchaeota archaeon]|nr:hypothetical protein [Candidatus Woesearchaeota archaeon]
MSMAVESPIVRIDEVNSLLRAYMRAIATVPIEILFNGNTGLGIGDARDRDKAIIANFPEQINVFEDREDNKMTYVALAALNAAQFRYNKGFNNKTLADIVKAAYKEGKERFGKHNPVHHCQAYLLSGLEGTEPGLIDVYPKFDLIKSELSKIELPIKYKYNFAAYFLHFNLMGDLIGIIERGRIMGNFFRDFPASYDWCSRNLSYFYDCLAKDIIKRSCSARPTLQSPYLFDFVMRRFEYSLLFQSMDFDNEFRKYQSKEDERHKSLADIVKYNPSRSAVLEQWEKAVKPIVEDLFNISRKIFESEKDIHDSVRVAVDLYFRIVELMLDSKLPILDPAQNVSVPDVERNIRDVLDNLNNVSNPRSMKDEKGVIYKREAAIALATRKKLSLVGDPSYHEWNYIQGRFMQQHVIVHEKDIPKPEQPVFGFSEPEESIERNIKAQFDSLSPEGLVIKRKLMPKPGRRMDKREYSRFLAKLKADTPVRPLFCYEPRREERSVAALLLIDVSDSTGELIDPEHSVLDKLKEATMYFAVGLDVCNDPCAIYAVTSKVEGKHSKGYGIKSRTTFFYKLKGFDDSLGRETLRERLNQLEPQYKNRDGAIIRHGTYLLSSRPEEIKLLIYLNDGAPHDDRLFDPTSKILADENRKKWDMEQQYEGRYAWADMATAVQEAAAFGVTPLVIRVNQIDRASMKELRGTGVNFRKASFDMKDLAKVIAESYVQLTH